MVRTLIAVSGFLAVCLLSVGAAHADAIDGHWCHKAKRLSIDGPKIVTPGGRQMTGDYDRHGFRFISPAGEGDAGKAINLDLLDDDTLQWRSEGKTKPEMWKRCRATVS